MADTESLPDGLDAVPDQADQRLLLVSIFIIAGCSLIYELLISSLSTYLLGSSVIHYSITIGLFLFFMGVGSWLAQYIRTNLLDAFVLIELGLGLVGGLSALLLYTAYAWTEYYYPAMVCVIAVISILVGMEIPLLTRIIERGRGIRQGISDVLATDYVGALLASILFPFILLPYLSHLLTAFAIGAVNILVALVVAFHFKKQLRRGAVLLAAGVVGVCSLFVVSQYAGAFSLFLERSLYQDPVIYSTQSKYQKIVVTERGQDLRLFLNGSLQFSSLDEYRYHEPLTHLPAVHARRLERALIIGGGDGLAARELLHYPDLNEIVLVDIDAMVTSLSSNMAKINALSRSSLENDRVSIYNEDAWRWLEKEGDLFDVVIIDLPDPDTAEIARLYSVEFYRKAARRMSVGGVLLTQASSPWLAKRAFWGINHTLHEVFDFVQPVYSDVPSFGPWGFMMASNTTFTKQRMIPSTTKYITEERWQFSLETPNDLQEIEAEPNRLQTLKLVQYYAEDYQSLQSGE